MDTLISSYAHLMLVDGVFQADPHPGNLLLTQRPVVQPTVVAAVWSSGSKQHQQTVAATTGSEGEAIRNARIKPVGNYESRMVYELRVIFCVASGRGATALRQPSPKDHSNAAAAAWGADSVRTRYRLAGARMGACGARFWLDQEAAK